MMFLCHRWPLHHIGLVIAIKLVGNEPHASLFDLNDKTMNGWVMNATDALGKEDDLQNYVDIAMLFTFVLPPKAAKQTPKKTNRKAD